MHYIRFVKFPHVERDRSKPSSLLTVSALVTVETDLGEAFLSQDITLQASFRADTAERTLLASQKVSWKKGLRLVKVQMTFEAKGNTCGILCVSASERRADDLRKEVFPDGILSIWSPPLPFDGIVDKNYVERKLILTESKVVSIWEVTGQSIARHIWDGGLAFASYAALFLKEEGLSTSDSSSLPSFHELISQRKAKEDNKNNNEGEKWQLRILELGTGVGVVGLVLSVLLEQSRPDITITDLEAAREIANKNLNHSRTLFHPDLLRYKNLDWDGSLPEWITSQPLDAVVFADCIYNTVSIPSLVKTLSGIAKHWPDVLIVFAYKVRHDSEDMFFELARENGFETHEHVLFGNIVNMYTLKLVK